MYCKSMLLYVILQIFLIYSMFKFKASCCHNSSSETTSPDNAVCVESRVDSSIGKNRA